jgi:hypothetical protein
MGREKLLGRLGRGLLEMIPVTLYEAYVTV